MFETFEHTADVGLRIRAADLDTLFAEAGRALASLVVANLEEVRPLRSMPIDLAADSTDLLLFDWLSELLFIFETQHLLLVDFEVHATATSLAATARGEPMDRARHRLEHEVKAITYHGLKVERGPQGWLAEVIVDI
jgi:SHS2 domain-containing protein